jgi:hypothetical protein
MGLDRLIDIHLIFCRHCGGPFSGSHSTLLEKMGGMNAGVCHQDRGNIADGKLAFRVNRQPELMTVLLACRP